MVGGGISVHNTYVINTFRPLCSEVYDENIPLQIFYVLQRGPFELVLPSTHGATCVEFGVVTHVNGGEGLACMARDLLTEIIVTRCYEAYIIAVKGMIDVKCRPTSITMFR